MVSWERFPPTKEDLKRLRDYRTYERLFEGEGTESDLKRYLGARLFGSSRREIGIIVNYPGVIARVAADFLFGEAPQFELHASPSGDTAPGQEVLTGLVEANDLPTCLYESALSAASDGDAVLRVRWDGERVVIEEVPAASYFVTLHPDNCRVVLAQHVAWLRYTEDGKPLVLLVETHLPGWVNTQAFEVSGAQMPLAVGRELDLAEVFDGETLAGVQPEAPTRIKTPTLFHVPNYRTGKRYWGISDYKDLPTLFDAVNNRMSRIDQYLDKHSRPKLVTPPGMLGPDGNIADQDVFEPLSAELAKALPRYVTWDGQMQSSFQQLEHLVDSIFKVSEIAPAVFGLDKAGSIESGRAMRMRFIRTVAKIARKRTHYDRAIKRALRAALDMQKAWVPDSPDLSGKIEIVWADGMPQDYLEAIEAEAKRVEAKIGSRKSAVKNIDLVGDEKADAELARIQAEQTQFGAPAPGPAPAAAPAETAPPA